MPTLLKHPQSAVAHVWASDRRCLLQLYASLFTVSLRLWCLGLWIGTAVCPKDVEPCPSPRGELRLATGAFRLSPVLSLYAETHQMSLEGQRQYLSLCYGYKVYSDPHHPCYALQTCMSSRFFENKPSIVWTFSIHVESMTASFHIPLTEITLLQNTDRVAPWGFLPI